MKKAYKRIRWEIPTVFLLFSMFYSMLSAQQIGGQQLATALQQRTTQDQRSAMLETYIKNTSGTFAQQIQKLNGLVSQDSAKTANFTPQIQTAFTQKFMELYNQRNNNPNDLPAFNAFMQEALKTNFLSATHKTALQANATQVANNTAATNEGSQPQTVTDQIPTIAPVQPIAIDQETPATRPQDINQTVDAPTVQQHSEIAQVQTTPSATQQQAIPNTIPVAEPFPVQALPEAPQITVPSQKLPPQSIITATQVPQESALPIENKTGGTSYNPETGIETHASTGYLYNYKTREIISPAGTRQAMSDEFYNQNKARLGLPELPTSAVQQASIPTLQPIALPQATAQGTAPVAVAAITKQPDLPKMVPLEQQPEAPIAIGGSIGEAPLGGHTSFNPETGIERRASTGYSYDYKNREIISPAGTRQKMSDEFYNQNRARLGLPELPTTVAQPTVAQQVAIPTQHPTIQPDINATKAPNLITQQQQQVAPATTHVNPDTITATTHGIQTIENIHNLTAQIQALHKLMQKAVGHAYDAQTQSSFATELVKVFNKVRTMQTYTTQLLVGASHTALLNREQQNYVKNFMIPGLEFKPQAPAIQQSANNQTIPLSTADTGNVIPTAVTPTTSNPTTGAIPLETAKKKKKKKKRKKGKKGRKRKKKKKKHKTKKGKRRKKKKGSKKKANRTKKKKRKKNKKAQ